MDGGAWWASVHGVVKSWTRLSNFTFTFHFHALEKEMATHSSVLAWRIPGTGVPGGCRLWGRTESDMTEATQQQQQQQLLPTSLLSLCKLNLTTCSHIPIIVSGYFILSFDFVQYFSFEVLKVQSPCVLRFGCTGPLQVTSALVGKRRD